MLITASQVAQCDRPTAAASGMLKRSGLRDSHVSGTTTNRACVPGRFLPNAMPSAGPLPQTSWPM